MINIQNNVSAIWIEYRFLSFNIFTKSSLPLKSARAKRFQSLILLFIYFLQITLNLFTIYLSLPYFSNAQSNIIKLPKIFNQMGFISLTRPNGAQLQIADWCNEFMFCSFLFFAKRKTTHIIYSTAEEYYQSMCIS